MKEPVTLDDIVHKWDSQAVLNVCKAFQGIAALNDDSARVIERNLYGLTTWDGDTAEASKHAIGKTVADVKKQSRQATAIASAFRTASDDVESLCSDVRKFINKTPYYMVIDLKTNISAIDPSRTGGVITPEMKTTLSNVQDDIDGFIGRANRIDEELAHAIRLADGDITTKPNPTPITDPQHHPGDITAAQLYAIMTSQGDIMGDGIVLTREQAEKIIPYLNEAMWKAHIDTPERKAAFLAQIAEESAGLSHMSEASSGANYEGRPDLGNTRPGDGLRYKGRGAIQITGRNNYAKVSQFLYGNPNVLLNNPDLLDDPAISAQAAAAYWQIHNLNRFLPHLKAGEEYSQLQFQNLGSTINRGHPGDIPNGEETREAYWNVAKRILGAS